MYCIDLLLRPVYFKQSWLLLQISVPSLKQLVELIGLALGPSASVNLFREAIKRQIPKIVGGWVYVREKVFTRARP